MEGADAGTRNVGEWGQGLREFGTGETSGTGRRIVKTSFRRLLQQTHPRPHPRTPRLVSYSNARVEAGPRRMSRRSQPTCFATNLPPDSRKRRWIKAHHHPRLRRSACEKVFCVSGTTRHGDVPACATHPRRWRAQARRHQPCQPRRSAGPRRNQREGNDE